MYFVRFLFLVNFTFITQYSYSSYTVIQKTGILGFNIFILQSFIRNFLPHARMFLIISFYNYYPLKDACNISIGLYF
jgi:hypothetical protein